MQTRIKLLNTWRVWCGLLIIFGLFTISLISALWETGAAGAGTDAYYTMKPGETLEEVASHFLLATRTLRCVNPDYRLGDKRIILPLTSARRHQVQPGQTLGEIVTIYRVEISDVTSFPLNYWRGCTGSAGLGPETAQAELPAGLLLYVPEIRPVRFLSDLNGFLALTPTPGQTTVPAPTKEIPLTFSPVKGLPTFKAGPVAPFETATPVPTTPQAVSSPSTPVPSSPTPATPRPATTTSAPKTDGLIWPVRGIITTRFSPVTHPGIDIANNSGTPIVAAQAGLVYFAGWSPYGYGNFVQIEHGEGRQSHYAHLSRFIVKYGDFVQQGQVIGYMGSTGNSTGPHLHFELVQNGQYIDPLNYLPQN